MTKKRLGLAAEQIHWLVADITEAQLERGAYDVWHDRAVFHFLSATEHRAAYVRQVGHAVKPGGHVIASTFGLQDPTKCSGLDVIRYDAESLHDQFGVRFRLVESSIELQRTPFGTNPAVSVCYCQGRTSTITWNTYDRSNIVRPAGCLSARSSTSSSHHRLDDRRGGRFARDGLEFA